MAHLFASRYEEAVECADRALDEQPTATHVLGCKAVACSHLGRIEEGGDSIRRFCELRPGSTVANVEEVVRTFLSPEMLVVYVNGLRKAGMPEE
jgi:hypothetical protein